jgi:hypothetical protein
MRPDLELRDLVVWAMSFTCKNIVYDSTAACARVTIVSPGRMSQAEAWQLFVAAVHSVGLEVEEQGKTVSIRGTARCAAPVADASPVAPPPVPDAPDPDPAIETIRAGITAVDDVTYQVTRTAFDELIAHGDDVTAKRWVRIVPAIRDGQPRGYKLYALRPSSLAATLGFRNGDTLLTVDGQDVRTMASYGDLSGRKRIVVGIERRGNAVTLTYTITGR